MSEPMDFTAVKAKQQAAWSSGNYAVVGTTIQIVGEMLCEALDLRSGSKVLDVAAGNGNASLAAARRWCEVTSTDYVESLLDRGKMRAEADGLKIHFQQADAENLPFADGAFDVVTSTFGVMFTPDQAKAASEMARVCKAGGKIGLANWTPASFVGQLFKTIGKYIPPAPGVQSPALWGTEERLAQLFPGMRVGATSRQCVFRYYSPAHWLEIFRTYYGPLHKAFAALDAERQIALEHDVLELLGRFNQSGDATLVLPSEYLEVVIVK
jgi:SAM-dependent methyltransferase